MYCVCVCTYMYIYIYIYNVIWNSFSFHLLKKIKIRPNISGIRVVFFITNTLIKNKNHPPTPHWIPSTHQPHWLHLLFCTERHSKTLTLYITIIYISNIHLEVSWEYGLQCVYYGNVYCILCTIVYFLLYIVQICILCKVCILLFMYIVHFSRLFACTAMAQSLVPKNFTIGTLVYMMCDNKLIWFEYQFKWKA